MVVHELENKVKEKIGTCTLWNKKVDIYGLQKCKNGDVFSVLVKVSPNICNNFQEYTWQRYGIDNVERNYKRQDFCFICSKCGKSITDKNDFYFTEKGKIFCGKCIPKRRKLK